jgi:hypothetical protein
MVEGVRDGRHARDLGDDTGVKEGVAHVRLRFALVHLAGIEDFTDSNGDGQYTCPDWEGKVDGVPFRPLIDACKVNQGEPKSDMGDPFLDAGIITQVTGVPAVSHTLDNTYTAANGDLPFPYGHTSFVSTGDGHWGLNYIRAQAEVVFSGSGATIVRQKCTATGCVDWNAATDGAVNVITGLAGAAGSCSIQSLDFRLVDLHNNPLPKDTTVSTSDAEKIAPLAALPSKVPSTSAVGGTFHSIGVKPEAVCTAGYFTLNVTTPKGTTTSMRFFSN